MCSSDLFFRLYMFTALAPLPLASFAGQTTSSSGRAFIKSYIGVCMEGAVIVLACLIYSAFLSSSAPAVDSSLPAVTMAWQYIGQLIFNMLILTGLVRGASRIVRRCSAYRKIQCDLCRPALALSELERAGRGRAALPHYDVGGHQGPARDGAGRKRQIGRAHV